MDYNLLLLIAVILLFFIYHRFQSKESLNQIDSPQSMEFLDETILRIRCQFKKFDWLEPYLNNSSRESIGSGFFIDDQGHILTNFHVVEEAIKVFIQIPKFAAGLCFTRQWLLRGAENGTTILGRQGLLFKFLFKF